MQQSLQRRRLLRRICDAASQGEAVPVERPALALLSAVTHGARRTETFLGPSPSSPEVSAGLRWNVCSPICSFSWRLNVFPNHLREDHVLVFTAYSTTDEALVLPNLLPSPCRSCSTGFCCPLLSQPEPSDFYPLETRRLLSLACAETGGWF